MAGADETVGMKSPPDPHYRHRFPAEIISHAVWLYHVFSLSPTLSVLSRLFIGSVTGVSREWGDHAALANRSFWLACG